MTTTLSTTTTRDPSKLVETKLNYHLSASKGGVTLVWLGTVGERRRPHHTVPVQVEDVRGHEDDYDLDVQGFQVVTSPSDERDFNDDDRIKSKYYAECTELIKRVTGASWAKVVAHVLRTKNFDEAIEKEKDLPDMEPVGAPTNARFVHVDQSYQGAEERLPIWLGESEAKAVSGKRWAIINVWRAIEIVQRDNLCMCDARSVSDDELEECVVKFAQSGNTPTKGQATDGQNHDDGKDYRRAYVGKKDNRMWEVLPPKPGEQKHRWHYVSGLKPEEALLLKIYDTKLDGTARRTPHSAFTCSKDTGPTRKSIEARCIVVWEDQAAS